MSWTETNPKRNSGQCGRAVSGHFVFLLARTLSPVMDKSPDWLITAVHSGKQGGEVGHLFPPPTATSVPPKLLLAAHHASRFAAVNYHSIEMLRGVDIEE